MLFNFIIYTNAEVNCAKKCNLDGVRVRPYLGHGGMAILDPKYTDCRDKCLAEQDKAKQSKAS